MRAAAEAVSRQSAARQSAARRPVARQPVAAQAVTARAVAAAEAEEWRAQGAVSFSPRAGWRLGWLSLSGDQLAFSQPGRRGGLRVALGTVTALAGERRTFVVTSKPVLHLTWQPDFVGLPRSCWLITARIGDWGAVLGRRVAMARAGCRAGTVAAGGPGAAGPGTAPGPDPLAAGLAGLSGAAAVLLDYLACRGHATTGELMALTGVDAEEALLARVREGFGPVESALGGPAVRYEGAYFDEREGVVRRQEWRADPALARAWLAARDGAEILVEDEEMLVIISVPAEGREASPVLVAGRHRQAPGARLAADGWGLAVGDGHGHERWIALPERGTGEAQAAIGATGTLVVRVRRAEAGRR